ncbi:retinol dehydrogenase 12 isoform X2 [Betta splendens]|uniref:Retinol dehydrogenase 12 isoform X2 n=1 Tax=Betta splendens TaxID=158456 RepID=A0A9W2Y0N0_BETSP|nr:retinol dehydrogenase 12 isoform X2 [Betta splendens]
MYFLYTILASLVSFFILKWLKKRRYCTDVKRLDGKTVLITGGNSGVGKETAVALAMRGARVIIACRDVGKAEKAVREIKFRSRSLNVLHMELDLANLQSVRDFCKSFLQGEKRLDVLVNNAGMPSVLDWTDDGYSMCFGVNHLGHFLLTNLLLPRLKECAPSRVVTLTCSNYKYQKLDFHDLNYNLLPFFTYCRSKLANIYFSQELAHLTEGKGVTCFAVHPGFVQSGWTCHYSILFRMLMQHHLMVEQRNSSFI